MTNGLAIWHYPHRTMAQNIRFFAERGFAALSVHGARFVEELARGGGEEVARAIISGGVTPTVHYALPRKHDPELVQAFVRGLDAIGTWQRTWGLIRVLSFDVPAAIRDNAYLYIAEALERVENCAIAVEDFGLNEAERAQLAPLRGNDRFGYLVDIGHLFIRMRGERQDGRPLFAHAEDESPMVQSPTAEDFKDAFLSKDFPIFEMHLHNNDGVRDVHLFLEDGIMDVSAVAHAVRDIGFDGVMTIESAPGYQFDCFGDDADRGILKTYAYWQSLCRSE